MSHITQLFEGNSAPLFSFEFFPPKTAAAEATLRKTLDELTPTNPNFISITYGAMGSTRDTTKKIVTELSAQKPFPVMAHLTCVGHSRAEINQLLDEYAQAGVDNLLALSGDPVEGEQDNCEFKYALDLVELVLEHPHDFSVGVAAHPEIHPRSKDRKSDRKYLAQKLELANFAITQFFFDTKYYFELIDELGELGNTKPIIPGVIPVISTDSVLRFSKLNKVEVDQDFIASIEATDDRLGLAVDYAWEMIQELVGNGALGIHLYTLNQSAAALSLSSLWKK